MISREMRSRREKAACVRGGCAGAHLEHLAGDVGREVAEDPGHVPPIKPAAREKPVVGKPAGGNLAENPSSARAADGRREAGGTRTGRARQ
jgi:hypothetical protein